MANNVETLAGIAIKAHPELLGPSNSNSSSNSPYPPQGAVQSPSDHPANNMEPMQTYEHPLVTPQGFGSMFTKTR